MTTGKMPALRAFSKFVVAIFAMKAGMNAHVILFCSTRIPFFPNRNGGKNPLASAERTIDFPMTEKDPLGLQKHLTRGAKVE
jgi:hypothetical protein